VLSGAFVFACASAAAASETLHVSTIPSAVAGGEPFQLTAAGTTANGQAHLAIFGQPASEPCAATAQQDGGTEYVGAGVEETFDETFPSPLSLVHGTYLLCGYVFDGTNNEPLSRDEEVLTVSNRDSVTLSGEPQTQIQGQPQSVNVTGYADAPVEVAVTFKPAGAGCAASAAADNGTRANLTGAQSGEYATSVEAPPLGPGSYLVCAWLEPPEAPGDPPLAASSLVLVVHPYQASVSLSAPPETAYGANLSLSVGYSVNAPSELYVLEPFGTSACAASWQSVIGVVPGINPLYEPFTEARGRFLGSALSGRFALAVPSPPHPGRYVVCAWLQAGAASTGPFSTTFTALPFGQLPTPSRLHGRPYRGHTSQHLQLVLAYAHGRISDLAYEAFFRCANYHGAVREHTELSPFRVGGHGRFAHHWAKGSDRGTVQGRVRGSRVVGVLSEVYRSQSGSTCRTPRVAFTAMAR
jgi:hypothetical protein